MSVRDPAQQRLTKIVCTIGPSSSKPAQLRELVEHGMNIARLNLAHESAEGQRQTMKELQRIRSSESLGLGILFDIRCAQIRTSPVKSPIVIRKESVVSFGVESLRRKLKPGETFIGVDYPAFGKDARKATTLLIDNGELSFEIVSVSSQGLVRARALQDGSIGTRRHINLPGADLSLPTFTAQDWKDIACAVEEGIDILAISFVRTAKDIQDVRAFLRKKRSTIMIIAKIETRQAVANLSSIIDAADGIMVARGDLGAEVPFEDVPAIQDHIVRECRALGKPVIVATQMLESMIRHPIPTRAEVTDVSHAAVTLTDATMLSGETASGWHPSGALDAMDRILRATELRLRSEQTTVCPILGEVEARAQVAVQLAHSLNVDAIVVMSHSGRSARAVSKFRPHVPIIAITDQRSVWGQLALSYGVSSILSSFAGSPETSANRGIEAAKKTKCIGKGAHIVLVSETDITGGSTISVQPRRIQ